LKLREEEPDYQKFFWGRRVPKNFWEAEKPEGSLKASKGEIGRRKKEFIIDTDNQCLFYKRSIRNSQGGQTWCRRSFLILAQVEKKEQKRTASGVQTP